MAAPQPIKTFYGTCILACSQEPATCHYAEWYRVHTPCPIPLRSISILPIGPHLDLPCGLRLPGVSQPKPSTRVSSPTQVLLLVVVQ